MSKNRDKIIRAEANKIVDILMNLDKEEHKSVIEAEINSIKDEYVKDLYKEIVKVSEFKL